MFESESNPPGQKEETLRAEILRLNKIIQALMNRAERSTSVQGSDFSLFQTAIVLEDQVRLRTEDVEAALRENEKINRALQQAKELMELEFLERKRAQEVVVHKNKLLEVQKQEVIQQKKLVEQAMTELQIAQQQLVFQEKMASVGTLTAGVAHEINNPANFAHAGAQVLEIDLERFRRFLLELAEGAETEVLDRLNQHIDALVRQVDSIVEGTSRIRGLVRDLRTFSRLDEAEKKVVSIADSLLSTVHLVRTQYAQSTEILCELMANPVLECWPAQLNQVFMNLIINACHAIQTRKMKTGDTARGTLWIRSRMESGWLTFEFEDSGCGIAPGVIGRIFEPFFTTKKVGEGVGLGLSISFGIIERHGGDIQVRSTEGEGTCFTMRLPLQRKKTVDAGTGQA